MSGTSLDGLDLAACIFRREKNNWEYSVEEAVTIPYSAEWERKLGNAHLLTGDELMILHSGYGELIAREVTAFIAQTGFQPHLVASHGHTVFHRPDKRVTFQAGNGAVIAAMTGITTVADFRITDVALGGQGAPLVPAGDRLLFSQYDFCLNLGGFANISYVRKGRLLAYDLCPVNFALNHLARKTGRPYDFDGEIGRSGQLVEPLLEKMNSLGFYSQTPPKSLAREWMEENFFPLIDDPEMPVADLLRTVYEHIAQQITRELPGNGRLLITGGGALNKFLVEKISEKSTVEIVLPDKKIINFKEALIFAFLGLLRSLGEINCFSSVTGAKKDSSCGIIFVP